MALVPNTPFASGGVLQPTYLKPLSEPNRTRDPPMYANSSSVVAAFERGDLTYAQASNILMNQFGFSWEQVSQVLIIEEDTPSTTPSTTPELPQYSSSSRVIDAFRQGLLNYDQAYSILTTQFGFTNDEAVEALADPSIDSTEFDEETLTPNEETLTPKAPSIPLSDDQRFLLTGMLIIGFASRYVMR